jgi:hypothetical protein
LWWPFRTRPHLTRFHVANWREIADPILHERARLVNQIQK